MLSSEAIIATLNKMIDESRKKILKARDEYSDVHRISSVAWGLAQNMAALDVKLNIFDYAELQKISHKDRITGEELNACERELAALQTLKWRLFEMERENNEDYDERWEEPRE